jgi:hypothetical protein
MKITLEIEDCMFTSTASEFGNERWLVVKIAGRQFFVRRKSDSYELYYGARNRLMEEVDRVLVDEMQLMIETILLKAAAEVPEGAIDVRCPTGDIFRYHYEKRCKCAVIPKVKAEGQ